MRRGVFGFQVPFQHFFHQEDAAAWRIGFIAQHFIGRTGRQAKSTVNTTGNGLGHRVATRSERFNGNAMQHQRSIDRKMVVSRQADPTNLPLGSRADFILAVTDALPRTPNRYWLAWPIKTVPPIT